MSKTFWDACRAADAKMRNRPARGLKERPAPKALCLAALWLERWHPERLAGFLEIWGGQKILADADAYRGKKDYD